MKLLRAGACLALALPATSVLAEVRQAAPDGFFLAFTQSTTVSPARAYAAVAALPRWWSDEHTWSGKAANLSLKAEAGGCFCERWADGSAEHGRVLMAIPGKLLRLETALGPLQEFALTGVLTFWVRYNEDGTARIDVEYRVNGSSASALDQWAPQVDDMLGAQFARFVRYIGTGDPEDHAKSGAADGDTPRGAAARAAVLEEWKQQIERDAAARKATAPVSPVAAHPAAGGKP